MLLLGTRDCLCRFMIRYSFTKQCNIWFAQYLAREFTERHLNILSLSCEPGWAATGTWSDMLQPLLTLIALQEKATGSLFGSVTNAMNNYFAQSAEAGAMPILHAAFSSNVKQGDVPHPVFLLTIRRSLHSKVHDVGRTGNWQLEWLRLEFQQFISSLEEIRRNFRIYLQLVPGVISCESVTIDVEPAAVCTEVPMACGA